MPVPYFKAPPRYLPPEELEKALARFRKRLAHGVPCKTMMNSGGFRGVPRDLLQQISSEERRNKSKRQDVRGREGG